MVNSHSAANYYCSSSVRPLQATTCMGQVKIHGRYYVCGNFKK